MEQKSENEISSTTDDKLDKISLEKKEQKKKLARERYKRYCEKNPTAATERQKKYMKNLRTGYKKLLNFYENMKQNVGDVDLERNI